MRILSITLLILLVLLSFAYVDAGVKAREAQKVTQQALERSEYFMKENKRLTAKVLQITATLSAHRDKPAGDVLLLLGAASAQR